MDTDRLKSTRIIHQEVKSRDDLGNAFDRITYEKGAAVLAMFEQSMGEAGFREGVSRFLASHAFDAATTRDFISALAVNDPEIGDAFNSFIEQPGFPRVEFTLQCEGAPTLKLAQKRSLPLGSPAPVNGLWQVPICVRYGVNGGVESACTMLKSVDGTFVLPNAKSCPAWVQANAGGSGYYRPLYRGDLMERMLNNGIASQTQAEIVALMHDAQAGAQAGEIPVAEVLALGQRFADGPSRHLVDASLSIAYGSGEILMDGAELPRYANLLQKWFGDRARKLGFETRKGDDQDTRLLRMRLVPFVADGGDDVVLLGEAKQLADHWLSDHASVDATMVRDILHVAAQRGDKALFERVESAAKTTKDRRERETLLSTLGAFRDPASLASSLELTLSPDLESRDSITVVSAALDNLHTQRQGLDFIEANYDALVKRLPPHSAARLPRWLSGFCDQASRNEISDFFGPRMASQEGGTRNLAQALERIDLCIAYKAQQQAGAKKFLSGY